MTEPTTHERREMPLCRYSLSPRLSRTSQLVLFWTKPICYVIRILLAVGRSCCGSVSQTSQYPIIAWPRPGLCVPDEIVQICNTDATQRRTIQCISQSSFTYISLLLPLLFSETVQLNHHRISHADTDLQILLGRCYETWPRCEWIILDRVTWSGGTQQPHIIKGLSLSFFGCAKLRVLLTIRVSSQRDDGLTWKWIIVWCVWVANIIAYHGQCLRTIDDDLETAKCFSDCNICKLLLSYGSEVRASSSRSPFA